MDDQMIEKLRANAELVVTKLGKPSGFSFGYDTRSVEWLDGFIERRRTDPEFDSSMSNGLLSVLGSYLGEAIIRCYGGEWANENDRYPYVRFSAGNSAYPFSKVSKHFENGSEDSILSFFKVIPVLMESTNKE
jgi:hypothetical protein